MGPLPLLLPIFQMTNPLLEKPTGARCPMFNSQVTDDGVIGTAVCQMSQENYHRAIIRGLPQWLATLDTGRGGVRENTAIICSNFVSTEVVHYLGWGGGEVKLSVLF